MLHFKNKAYGPEHSREIINKARDLTSDMNVSVRVARIATKFVEFDVGVEKEDLDALVEKLSSIGPKFSTLTMKDFGNVMRHLKVLGKSLLDEKKKLFKEFFYLQLHLLMLKKMNSVLALEC